MSEEHAPAPTEVPESGQPGHDPHGPPSQLHWTAALLTLLETRVSIFGFEARQAASAAASSLIALLVAVLALVGTWILAVAASIGAIVDATGWSWFVVTFAAAGLHLALGIGSFLLARNRKSDPFPYTRAEFQKDREWLRHLHHRNNSPN